MPETPPPAATPEAVAPPMEPVQAPEPVAEEAPAEATAPESGVGDSVAEPDHADAAEGDALDPGASLDAGAASSDETVAPDPARGPANLSPAAVAALLAERFPALFGAGRALPIKLRVQADIQQRAPGLFSKKALSIFLHRYTTSTAYLKALATAPQRLDLDGAAAGEVDEVHRQAAAAEVERRQLLFAERRAAERELQRQAAVEARRAQAAQNAARHAARDTAESEARRNRAALLRAFETTTLTPANFCALKGLVEADLQGQLTQARQDREQRALEPQREFQREPRPPGPRPAGPRSDRGGRPAAERRGPSPGKPPLKPGR